MQRRSSPQMRPSFFCRFLLPVCVAVSFASAGLAEPPFRPNDVAAFVGGEEMVALTETGEFEALITKAFPSHKLRFRSLAWEGDTVYEQRRDLNYPSLEEQLNKVGATVVIAQFGTMESFDGEERVGDFEAALQKMIGRLSGPAKRRVILLAPLTLDAGNTKTGIPPLDRQRHTLPLYIEAMERVAKTVNAPEDTPIVTVAHAGASDGYPARDGVHLSAFVQSEVARDYSKSLGLASAPTEPEDPEEIQVRSLIRAKHRLWFNYYRPQNWAFLAGDRTNQPSSRDHKDLSKRWFPEELERFLPLIEQKETEIAAVFARAVKP